MSDIDLKGLSLPDLQKLQRQVEREVAAREKEAVKAAGKEIKQILAAHGVSANEAFEVVKPAAPKRRKRTASKKGNGNGARKVPPKYRHPEKPSLTWAGRGRKPKWLEAELEKGRKIEDFAI